MGSRTLLNAAAAGIEPHGQFLDDGEIQRPAPFFFLTSNEGRLLQDRVDAVALKKFEAIEPGVTNEF